MDRKPPYNPDEIPDIPSLENQGWNAMRQMLDEHMPQKEGEKRRVIPMYWRWMAAAVLLLLVGSLSYFYLTETKNTDPNDGIVSNNTNTTNPKGNVLDSPIVKHDNHNGLSKKSTINSNKNVASSLQNGERKKHLNSGSIADDDFAESSRQNDLIAKNSPDKKNQGANISNKQPTVSTLSDGIVSADKIDNKVLPSKIDQNKNEALAATSKVKTADEKVDEGFNTPKTINLDVKGLNNIQTLAKNNTEKENVEMHSAFRQRLNQAIMDDFQSDSIKQAEIAKAKKNLSDSQLVARRKEQLAAFFEKNEKEEKTSTHKQKAKVDLAVLVNRNMTDKNYNQSGNSLYSLPVYPAVNASVKLSDKVGFTTGVGTAAPGNFTNTSISGPVAMSSPAYSSYVNSVVQQTPTSDKAFLTSNSMTSSEVSLRSESASQVQQAYYWQIPLMFDYYTVQSRLKLSAGTDFSIIQKVLVGNSYSSQLMDGATYNNSGGVYQIRNFDPRLSVGAQYKINNFLFGARFSRSFQPAIQYNGAPTNGGNNQVFNFSIGYSFFK